MKMQRQLQLKKFKFALDPMPMITVDNRTNKAPLCHVGVIVEPQSSHVKTHLGYPQHYPASMVNAAGVLCRALETFLFC